jgi:ribosomal protein S18 acetylase RimI-like enzyme
MLRYRPATATDVSAIATLHAESWRQTYRGAYSDAYLDNDVVADRLAVWTERFRSPSHDTDTVLAEDEGVLVGFVHTIFDADPRWGALLDNLHVAPDRKGSGVGRSLMAHSASAVLDQRPGSALHLWVLEMNAPARSFYDACGGLCVGREPWRAPDGGTVLSLRYAWRDPSVLMARRA